MVFYPCIYHTCIAPFALALLYQRIGQYSVSTAQDQHIWVVREYQEINLNTKDNGYFNCLLYPWSFHACCWQCDKLSRQLDFGGTLQIFCWLPWETIEWMLRNSCSAKFPHFQEFYIFWDRCEVCPRHIAEIHEHLAVETPWNRRGIDIRTKNIERQFFC